MTSNRHLNHILKREITNTMRGIILKAELCCCRSCTLNVFNSLNQLLITIIYSPHGLRGPHAICLPAYARQSYYEQNGNRQRTGGSTTCVLRCGRKARRWRLQKMDYRVLRFITVRSSSQSLSRSSSCVQFICRHRSSLRRKFPTTLVRMIIKSRVAIVVVMMILGLK